MAEKDKRSPAQRVPLRPFDSLFEPTIPQKQPETGITAADSEYIQPRQPSFDIIGYRGDRPLSR